MTTFGDILKQAEQNGASFDVLEAGNYVAKIIESEYRTSSTNKPQIKTRWEVIAGPKAGFKGLWNYFTLTLDNPNALSIFYRQMSVLGITGEFLQSLANVDPATAMKHIAAALEGRAANIKVKVDQEYNNNKIERINPVPPEFSVPQAPGSADPFAQAAAPPVTQAPVAPPIPPAAQPAPVPAQPPVAAPAVPSASLPAPAAPEPLPAVPF